MLLNKVKYIIKLFLFRFIEFCLFQKAYIISKSILLIRLDAIGDYILFRNFIEIIRKSKEFRKYKITLVGNIIWKDLAEIFDREYVDNFIWIDKKQFNRNLFYRLKKLKEITKYRYEVVIQPTFSREFFSGDAIVKLVSSKEKIGSIGDYSNISESQKKISDKYYTRLIPAKMGIIFEFYRNKEFFEKLLKKKIKINKPFLDVKKIKCTQLNFSLPKQYVVVFIGANSDFRRWKIENFIHIIKYLLEKYKINIIICGGEKDIHLADDIVNNLKNKYVLNLTGKTSLSELVYIIANAKFLISNETSAPHIAVATDIPVIVISNGNHFGRFTPYPEKITNKYFAVYPPSIEKRLENYNELCNRYGYGSNLDINEIKPEKVINLIDKIFL